MPDWSVRRISKLLELCNGATYLEIGIADGDTFNRVPATRKIGVDPNMAYFKGPADDTSELIELDSDSFYRSLHRNFSFDVCFLDGLHESEQTFRDFCNSIEFSHHRSIWLVDDVFPNSPYSALRSQQESLQLRVGTVFESDFSWHGDVFKTVLMIQSFFSGFKVRTVFGSGNPQSIVWKSIDEHRPTLGLQEIASATYFDLMKNTGWLQPSSEEEVLEEIASDFRLPL